MARNFDYLPLVQPYYVLRDCRPNNGLRSLQFTTAPLVGAVDGLNEAGLCIVYDYAYTTDQPQQGCPPISMRISQALDQCCSVHEAIEFLLGHSRWGGALLMLADATGDLASLELASSRGAVRRPGNGIDCLFHSNKFQSPEMQSVELALDAVYTQRAPKALWGRRPHDSSAVRNARFACLLADTVRHSPDSLAQLMADHGSDDQPGDYTPCVHGSYWYTTACLQFLPVERRMRVSYSTACNARFVDFSI